MRHWLANALFLWFFLDCDTSCHESLYPTAFERSPSHKGPFFASYGSRSFRAAIHETRLITFDVDLKNRFFQLCTMPPPRFEVFRNLPDESVEKLVSNLPSHSFAPGDVLLRETDTNKLVYLVESGEIEAWKGEPKTPSGVRLATLKPGSCFGEMSALNGEAATANIVAATSATVRTLSLEDLPADGAVQKQVTLNLARTLVSRLSNTNSSLKAKHESELAAMKLVASASAFLTRILTTMSFYMFAMPLIAFMMPLLPTSSVISFFLILVFLWVVIDFINKAQIKHEDFHIYTRGWQRQVLTGVIWALPFMGAFLAVKIWLAYKNPDTISIFEPMRGLGAHAKPNYLMWAGFAFGYAALSFVQEYIRCVVQASLDMIAIPPTNGSRWKSILVADLCFSSLHMHMGGTFAFLSFVAGLVFGFMFWRVKSYIAVGTAHSVFGVWAIFVIGIPR